MAIFPRYADSYGQLAALLANDEAQQRQASELATSRLMDQRNRDREFAYRQGLDQQLIRERAQARADALAQNDAWLNYNRAALAQRYNPDVAPETAAVRTNAFKDAMDVADTEGVFQPNPLLSREANLAVQQRAMQARPILAQQDQRYGVATDVLNRRAMLRNALRRLDADIGSEPGRTSSSVIANMFYGTGGASKAVTNRLKQLRDRYQKELTALEPLAQNVASDEELGSGVIMSDPRLGTFSKRRIPLFMQTNAAPASVTGTNAPAVRQQTGPVTVPQRGGTNVLDAETAMQILQRAGGDPRRATAIAEQLGFIVPSSTNLTNRLPLR